MEYQGERVSKKYNKIKKIKNNIKVDFNKIKDYTKNRKR
jgi:hypothetical protein